MALNSCFLQCAHVTLQRSQLSITPQPRLGIELGPCDWGEQSAESEAEHGQHPPKRDPQAPSSGHFLQRNLGFWNNCCL